MSARFGITAGFDLGLQQGSRGSNELNSWYTPVFILRYQPADKCSIAGRAEYFRDRDQSLIVSGTPNGSRTTGISLNLDYSPLPNAMLRLEGRYLQSRDEIFIKEDQPRDNNMALTFSMAVGF